MNRYKKILEDEEYRGKNVDWFHCKVQKADKMLFSLHPERLNTLEKPGDEIFKRTGCWCALISRILKKS